MKTTIITSAAVFLTAAAATPAFWAAPDEAPSPTAEAEVAARSVVVPVLAPSGDVVSVASGEAAVPSLEARAMADLPEHEREARGIPAALHKWDPELPHVIKQTLTTPAPTPTPVPSVLLARGSEDEGGHDHGHGADGAEDSAEEVVSVVIGGNTILIPQEGITTVHQNRPVLARPTKVIGGDGHQQGQEDKGELMATVIKDGVSTVLPIGLQPTFVPLGKRCESHSSAEPISSSAEPVHSSVEPVHSSAEPISSSAEPVHSSAVPVNNIAEPADTTVTTTTSTVYVTSIVPTSFAPSPTSPPKEDNGEEEGGDDKEGDDEGGDDKEGDDEGGDDKEDDAEEDDAKGDDDKAEDKDAKEGEEKLEHNEIVVYYGKDKIYIPLEGPVSISYGPKQIWTDLRTEAPHTVVQTATVVQNGRSVTLAVSDLARNLPIGKTVPAPTTTDEGGPPLVTGYPYEWHSLHSRLAVTTSSDVPTPAATAQSLPRTFVTSARPTPHELHGEHDHNDESF
ncbi:hypothetical protein SLS62_008569 [Diatrype stigma]|uniref:Uncharacterized protein n=1 Tax=Diatrype stigma TaxID=117547 RepID=A0AAN9YKD0_9PEZI